MPSPFPGMDPWLENPAGWPEFHNKLVSELQTALNRVIRPRYVAKMERRVYLTEEPLGRGGDRVPDLQVWPADSGRQGPSVAVAELDAPAVYTTARGSRASRRREWRVEVREVPSLRVVTVIEVLSPTNKEFGSEGRASFLRKRREVMRSPAHWVEIDLLRAGEPTFPRPARSGPYAVHVSPAELRPRGRVWAFALAERMPRFGVPLLAGDPDAPLDLQAVFTEAYDRAALDATAGYAADPVPPLPPEAAAWADGVLRAAGFRQPPAGSTTPSPA